MPPLIECVPNFSEGNDADKVKRIAASIRSVPGVHVLDAHRDADHHRSVITFAGPPAAVEAAAVLATGEAARLIDLTRHRGVHPRIGATDVVPFVPLGGATLSGCAAIAHRAGREIWRRYQIPVYFYGAAALDPGRQHLENIRRGGFETLREAVATDSSRKPDVGEARLHPTAGATAVGAREALIAFNVNLDSNDAEIARWIAQAVRESSGGLPAVQAMGVVLRSRTSGGQPDQAQVSMNLTDWRRTSMAQAFSAVGREASRRGITIHSSEVVGLIPEGAIEGVTPESLRLIGFGPEKILENRLKEIWGRA
jgi:glutamate formiminotransferase